MSFKLREIEEEEEFDKLIAESSLPVIVDFHALWCPPCRRIEPFYKEMAEKNQDKYVCIKVDVDEAQELSRKHQISAMPTFKLFRNGKVAGCMVGAVESELAALFSK